jgi:hypothetical protein
MAEHLGEQRHAGIDVQAVSMPVDEGLDGKRMALMWNST